VKGLTLAARAESEAGPLCKRWTEGGTTSGTSPMAPGHALRLPSATVTISLRTLPKRSGLTWPTDTSLGTHGRPIRRLASMDPAVDNTWHGLPAAAAQHDSAGRLALVRDKERIVVVEFYEIDAYPRGLGEK
jgi:hypothetical protein